MSMKRRLKPNFMRFTCDYIMTGRELLPFSISKITVTNKTEHRSSGKKTICQKPSKENAQFEIASFSSST